MSAQIVSFHCVLKNKLGQVLSSSFNQDVINQLEASRAATEACQLRGLVAGIQNVREGERRHFTVPASEGFGLYDPSLLLTIRRSSLSMGDRLVLGSQVVTDLGPKGVKRVYRVVKVMGDTLELDANHPYAGHDLTFEIEVVSARAARSDDFEEPLLVAAPGHLVH